MLVETEVAEITASRSNPDRGTVLMRRRPLNQKGEEVQVSSMKLVDPRRSAG